jgi:predicted metal-dependent HD superfamily phosphohydrolase
VDTLLDLWLEALGETPTATAAGQELLARYAEPHRRYHDLVHLAEVLRALETLCAEIPRPVLLAAYWHDAVYEPTRLDNEERSAALAARTLRRLGLPPEEVEEVERLVLMTAQHEPAVGDVSAALLSDADLAILAAPSERYASYAAAVRAEYAHLDEESYRSGRSAVLRGLADRPRLFTTDEAHRRWDAPARENLHREIGRLGAGPPA